MRIYFRGNDKGYAALLSVTLILIFSIVFLSLVPYLINIEDKARRYRESVIDDIRKVNREIIETYDLY
jgi:hypothetical protein